MTNTNIKCTGTPHLTFDRNVDGHMVTETKHIKSSFRNLWFHIITKKKPINFAYKAKTSTGG